MKYVGTVAGLCLLALAADAESREREWYRYENGHFIAYSDASERRAVSLLSGLEKFRAAVSQVASLRVPDNAAKPVILIFRSAKDFDAISPGRNTTAFALGIQGQFRVVMRASGYSDDNLETIRHEYAHVLLGYSEYRYPRWYNEGFAGMMQSIRFMKKDTQFIMGRPPIGASFSTLDGFDWNTLVAKGWHNVLQGAQQTHDAYVQSWLLTHYAMIGDQFSHGPRLLGYFRALDRGEPPLAAFEEGFGMDANALWQDELKAYTRRMTALVFDFKATGLDLEFGRTKAERDLVDSLIDEVSASIIRVR